MGFEGNHGGEKYNIENCGGYWIEFSASDKFLLQSYMRVGNIYGYRSWEKIMNI